jgi:hypothetical protein
MDIAFKWSAKNYSSETARPPEDMSSNIHHNQNGLSRRIWFSSPQGETLKMSTKNISWGYRLRVRGADNLTTFKCRMSWKSGSLNLLEPSGPHRACYGTPLPLKGETCFLHSVWTRSGAHPVPWPRAGQHMPLRNAFAILIHQKSFSNSV